MPDIDLNFVLRRLDAIQTEVREGLRTIALRDEQRETSYQSMIQTLTRQMVQMVTEVDVRLASLDERLGRLASLDERLGRIETTLADITRKLTGMMR